MQAGKIIETTTHHWGVFVEMRRVLSQVRGPEWAALGVEKKPTEPWPGASLGVRKAEPDETPLSADEVAHGRMAGVL